MQLSILLFVLLLFCHSAYSKTIEDFCPNAPLSNSVGNQQFPRIIAVAVNPDNQDFLYCEYYFKLAQNRFITQYKDAEQNLIATKEVKSGTNLFQPEVYQQDLRHGEIRQVSLSESQETDEPSEGLYVKYQKPDSDKLSSATIALTDSLVVDAGFDDAIRQFWPDLIERKKVEIDFLSIVHLKPFRLTISQVALDRCPQPMFESDMNNIICFKVRPSSSLLNFFAKPLLLKYYKDTRRLKTFSGNVNITTKEGQTQPAVIHYTYTSTSTQAAIK